MTQVQNLARFVADASWEAISDKTRDQIKIRLLDSLACAIGAQNGEPARKIRAVAEELEGNGRCTLIAGGTAAPDRAALYNGALIRYLDFNDTYLAKGETAHPSDNIAAILAAGEYVNASGRELMTAIAVAYQVQCRLCDVAPVRARGFDHATHLAYSAAVGAAKVLGLDIHQIANAIALSGTALNSLRVTRTGTLSHWKGLAGPFAAAGALQLVLMARQGITAPLEVFEGNKGFMEVIAGHFEIDWIQENLDGVQRTLLKKYNAETHSQTAIEAVLQLRAEHKLEPAQVTRMDVRIFDVAHNIIGGGEEGDKTVVRTKEEADHSLPYVLAVALLDGQVMPQQYRPERILQQDVQELLRRVSIYPDKAYSARFPDAMMAHVCITLSNGQRVEREVGTFEHLSWEWAQQKFDLLASDYTSAEQRDAIVDVVANLERWPVADLMSLLAKVKGADSAIPRRAA
jgi:2-methylcitrate dehydratase